MDWQVVSEEDKGLLCPPGRLERQLFEKGLLEVHFQVMHNGQWFQ